MAIWQYELLLVPTKALDIGVIKSGLSSLLPLAVGWSDTLQMWGEVDGNRIELYDDGTPPELLVRFDLQKPSPHFLLSVLEFARCWNYEITGTEGNPIPLTTEGLVTAIMHSPSFRFVSNPQGFLESLREQDGGI